VVEAFLSLSSDGSSVGRFTFRAVPRQGEEITVPAPGSPGSVAYYAVESVGHLALPSDETDEINRPEVVLKVVEIT
jgi:hypothetical protein